MTSMASSVLARSDSQLASCRLACSSPAAARSPSSPTWSLLLAQGDLNHYVSFRPDESPLETAGPSQRRLSRQGGPPLGVGGVDVLHLGRGGDAEYAYEVGRGRRCAWPRRGCGPGGVWTG